MDSISGHYVILHRTEDQPSSNHATFSSGDLDPDFGLETPIDCYHMPLATWMGLGCPDTITLGAVVGEALPKD